MKKKKQTSAAKAVGFVRRFGMAEAMPLQI
jgi:hypothetical protein